MDIDGWRKQIDHLDEQLVQLLNQRAAAARAIGELKRNTQMPIYEPTREKEIFDRVRRVNRGPLPDRDLVQVYERIIDVMRKIQRDQIDGQAKAAVQSSGNEIEAETNE